MDPMNLDQTLAVTAMNTSFPPLLNMPPEILDLILCRLTKVELCRLARTCKSIGYHGILVANLYKEPFRYYDAGVVTYLLSAGKTTLSKFFKCLENGSRGATSVRRMALPDTSPDSHFLTLQTQCPNLEALDMRNCSTGLREVWVSNIPTFSMLYSRLRTLSIRCDSTTFEVDGPDGEAMMLDSDAEFDFGNANRAPHPGAQISRILSACPNLEVLVLDDSEWDPSPAQIEDLVNGIAQSAGPSLRTLRLLSVGAFFKQDLRRFLNPLIRLSQLRKIELCLGLEVRDATMINHSLWANLHSDDLRADAPKPYRDEVTPRQLLQQVRDIAQTQRWEIRDSRPGWPLECNPYFFTDFDDEEGAELLRMLVNQFKFRTTFNWESLLRRYEGPSWGVAQLDATRELFPNPEEREVELTQIARVFGTLRSLGAPVSVEHFLADPQRAIRFDGSLPHDTWYLEKASPFIDELSLVFAKDNPALCYFNEKGVLAPGPFPPETDLSIAWVLKELVSFYTFWNTGVEQLVNCSTLQYVVPKWMHQLWYLEGVHSKLRAKGDWVMWEKEVERDSEDFADFVEVLMLRGEGPPQASPWRRVYLADEFFGEIEEA
ncbi:MAG: hypothetical protein M1833_003555 [Piccolia ochrophora]|nr:MAG: hypothetical protein M1833_003555 [Piccolia ochrophora]